VCVCVCVCVCVDVQKSVRALKKEDIGYFLIGK